jgi:hypothetical protein
MSFLTVVFARQPVMRRHSEPYKHTRMFRRRSYGMYIKDKRDLAVHIFGAKYKRLTRLF